MKNKQVPQEALSKEKFIANFQLTNFGIAKIETQEHLITATSQLSQLNKYLDSIIEYKEKKTKPLNEALKVIRAETKPYEQEVQALIDSIRLAMTRYQTNLINTQKAQEQAIANKLATGKLSLDNAVTKLDALPTISKEVPTEEGLVQFREKQQLKIKDVSLIPRAFMLPDETLILEHLKAGKDIPGCEIETIQVPVNYR